jgi:hypothetical protein
MDRDGFKSACVRILGAQPPKNGIGTYSEKTLHAVLKYFCDPNAQKHEIKIGPFVADIADEEGIIEIQTAGFNRLRRKLEAFLADSQVTVVYPIAQTKWLIWIDETTGEITKRRKSPKKGTPCDIFRELYRIKPLLKTPNLTIRVVLLEIEEYRYLNGWRLRVQPTHIRSNRWHMRISRRQLLTGSGAFAAERLVRAQAVGVFRPQRKKRIRLHAPIGMAVIHVELAQVGRPFSRVRFAQLPKFPVVAADGFMELEVAPDYPA